MTVVVVKPLHYGQDKGTVRLDLQRSCRVLPPRDEDGASPGDVVGGARVVVEVDPHNTMTLLSCVLAAILASGDLDAIEIARRQCDAMLGATR